MSRSFSLLIAWSLIAPFSSAQDSKKDPRGVIQELDATNGTITLIMSESQKARPDRVRTFNLLKPDIPISDAEGKPLKLAELQADDRVYVKLVDDDVVAIRMAPPTLFGALTRVEGRNIAINTKIGEKALVVPESAKVFDANQPVELATLKQGATVQVVLSPDQKTVTEIRSGKGMTPITKLYKGVGVLIDFDRDQHALRVFLTSHFGDHSHLRELVFAKEPTFGLLYQSKPYREIAFEDLAPGVRVQYWTDAATRKVAHLEVEMPILGKRVAKALDRERRQLVIEDVDGERTLTLASHLKVVAADGVGLDQLEPQSVVGCGLSPDRKTVEVLRVWAK